MRDRCAATLSLVVAALPLTRQIQDQTANRERLLRASESSEQSTRSFDEAQVRFEEILIIAVKSQIKGGATVGAAPPNIQNRLPLMV
jgi:hypothetical protein